MRIVLALALTGCVHAPLAADRAALAQELFARATEAAERNQAGKALGYLLALHSPQLAGLVPPGAAALETKLWVLKCGQRPRLIQEPPIEDAWYLWPFDGSFWSDELEGYRFDVERACRR